MYSATNPDQKELMAKGVSYVAAAVVLPDLTILNERINSLANIVYSLRLEIEDIKTQLKSEEKTTIREVFPMPSNEIKESVSSYLKQKGEAYPSDIADALGISLKEVLAVISILKEEKKVAEA